MSGIVVYTKPACPQCDCTKRHLTKIGAAFTAVDITENDKAREAVFALGYSSAPVVVAGDVHFSGYRPDSLNRLTALVSADAA